MPSMAMRAGRYNWEDLIDLAHLDHDSEMGLAGADQPSPACAHLRCADELATWLHAGSSDRLCACAVGQQRRVIASNDGGA